MIHILRNLLTVNRREHPRVKTAIRVKLHLPEAEEPVQTKTQNLSVSGIEVFLPNHVKVMSEIDMELDLPDKTDPLQLRGRLVRSLPITSFWNRFTFNEERYSVGINFVGIPPSTRTRILKYLQTAMQ